MSIKKIKSQLANIDKIESIDEIVKLLKEDTQYLVLAWLRDYVALGSYQKKEFSLLKGKPILSEIDSLRIFNLTEELYLYRPKAKDSAQKASYLQGRYRIDTEGDEVYYKDVNQLLIGKTKIMSGENPEFIVIREDRGFELTIPAIWTNEEKAPVRMVLKTRNYLEEWENGQLSYNDHRFMDILPKEKLQ